MVDAANVVGMVPDGWWRRRAEATELLVQALGPVAGNGLDAHLASGLDWLTRPPLDVVLVVEGAAARVKGSGSVRVVKARGSGDDAIVRLVARAGERRKAVVTGDRGLRARLAELGAATVPPSALPPRARLRG